MIKTPKIGLLTRVVIAIALGILLGSVMPMWLGRGFATLAGIFSGFLGFSIPLIIFGLVAPSIGNMGSVAGKLLLLTIALAYGSTLFSGFFTYFACDAVFPMMISQGQMEGVDMAAETAFKVYFDVPMPPVMGVMTALVLAFVVGIGMSSLRSDALRNTMNDFSEIVNKLIAKVIIPALPVYIFCIFLEISASGKIAGIIGLFIKVIAVIFVLHIALLLLQFTAAGIISKKNPLILLKNMLPAYATALGTQSSAATIPVTLRCAIKNGADEPIAGFVVPLCATIHLAGSTMKIVSCAMAIMIISGMPYDFGLFAGFVFLLGITMVAAPGVPGGAIMAAVGVLVSVLGFDQTAVALMIALYIAMDSFGTACNVTGDGAITMIVNKYFNRSTKPI